MTSRIRERYSRLAIASLRLSLLAVPILVITAIGHRAEPRTADPRHDAHRRGLPFLLCEYAHAMGNGPGGLGDYRELFEAYRIANALWALRWYALTGFPDGVTHAKQKLERYFAELALR